MIIATWNLNNRVGKVRFRPEAAEAAARAGADLIVFTEFYPQEHEARFRSMLADAGYVFQLGSSQYGEVANRVLVVSRMPIEPMAIDPPAFDRQFPSNVQGVTVASLGLNVLGVRVPAYGGRTAPLLVKAWEWLERAAAAMRDQPAVIIGDLNVSSAVGNTRVGRSFRQIMENGWSRANPPEAATFFGHHGRKSEIDHILVTRQCQIRHPAVIRAVPGFVLAGAPGSISDHGLLCCDIECISDSF